MSQIPSLQSGIDSAPDWHQRSVQGSLRSIAGIAFLGVSLASAGIGSTTALAESADFGRGQIVEASGSGIVARSTAIAMTAVTDGPLMLSRTVETAADRARSLSSESRALRQEYAAKRKELRLSTALFSAICLGSALAILFGANPLFWTPIALGSLGVCGSSAIYLRRLGTFDSQNRSRAMI